MGKKSRNISSSANSSKANKNDPTPSETTKTSNQKSSSAKKAGGARRRDKWRTRGQEKLAASNWSLKFPSHDDGSVTIDLYTSLEGAMSGEYDIGNGESGVVKHWHSLDDTGKREIVNGLTEQEIWQALQSQISTKLRFTGVPREESVTQIVKLFMHALEVCEGRLMIPWDMTFETVGILLALEQRILKRICCGRVMRRAWAVSCFLAWLSPGRVMRCLMLLSIAVLGLAKVDPVPSFRNNLKKLAMSFFENEQAASKAEWKADCYMSALMLMRLVKTMEHYFVVLVLTLFPFIVSSIEAYSSSEHDQRVLGYVRDVVGYFNKVVLLWFARGSYIAMILVVGAFFPDLGIWTFSTLLLGTAVGARFVGRMVWKLFPEQLKRRLTRLWSVRLFKICVQLALAVCGIAIIYMTWDFPLLWSLPIHSFVTLFLLFVLPIEVAPTLFTAFCTIFLILVHYCVVLLSLLFKNTIGIFFNVSSKRMNQQEPVDGS